MNKVSRGTANRGTPRSKSGVFFFWGEGGRECKTFLVLGGLQPRVVAKSDPGRLSLASK